jgi:hypothetical protein
MITCTTNPWRFERPPSPPQASRQRPAPLKGSRPEPEGHKRHVKAGSATQSIAEHRRSVPKRSGANQA